MKTALDSRQGGPRRFPVPVEGATAASVPMTGAIVPKRVTNLHLVREHDRRRARDLSAVALVLAPLALVLLVFAWENVEVIRRGYDFRKIEAARDRLAEENRRLRPGSPRGPRSPTPSAARARRWASSRRAPTR